MLHGFLKAFTDRTLWGSDPKDSTPLWLDDWAWFQRWKKDKLLLPGFPWVPIDAWHLMDAIKYVVGFFAGVSFLSWSGGLEPWLWCVVGMSGLTLAQTTKWLFFEILFWKNPMDGYRNWKDKWL